MKEEAKLHRLTRKIEDANYIEAKAITAAPEGFTGEAIDRLAAYEDFHQNALQTYQQLSMELEKLREQGKMKTLRFKELMGKKLMAAHVLTLLKLSDLEVEQ